MPDLLLVRISPGDRTLSGTEILMKQITKAQRVTLNNRMNAEAEEDDKPRDGPNTSRWEYQANYSGNQTTNGLQIEVAHITSLLWLQVE